MRCKKVVILWLFLKIILSMFVFFYGICYKYMGDVFKIDVKVIGKF